jgi:histidyl-tRNA synthetase
VLAILGPDEIARGEVAIRDLTTRAQQSVARDAVVPAVQALLTETRKDVE